MPHAYDLYKAQEGTATTGGTAGSRLRERIGRTFRGGRAGGIGLPTFDQGSGEKAGAAGDFWAMLENLYSQGGLGGGSGTSSQIVVPPVLELLAEMRERRSAAAEQAVSLAEIIGSNVPRGMEFYPGYEPGGVADVLLGIITGEGVNKAQQVLPEGQRRVMRTGIPVPSTNPTVGEEFGDASALAQAILNSLRVIQTGSSSSLPSLPV